MPNTSANVGYIQPTYKPDVLEGAALQDFLHDWLVGVSNVQKPMIRPRWQPEPPNIPDVKTDWMAFGIVDRESSTFPYEGHDGTNLGHNTMIRHEQLTVLISVYGPNADITAHLIRENAMVAQNREVLFKKGFAVKSIGGFRAAPEMIKQQWMYRVDFEIVFNRKIEIVYPILNIASAEVQIQDDSGAGVMVQINND